MSKERYDAFDGSGTRLSGSKFRRYEVEAGSILDLWAEHKWVVLELNGVMGEPAHMYQPGERWRKGVADLCEHFKEAVEIVLAREEKGTKLSERRDLLDFMKQHSEKGDLKIDEFDW